MARHTLFAVAHRNTSWVTNQYTNKYTNPPETMVNDERRLLQESGLDKGDIELLEAVVNESFVNLDIFLEPVNPGVSTDGRVIYEVAPDATDFTLTVDDVELAEDESAVYDLSDIGLRSYEPPNATATATASPGP